MNVAPPPGSLRPEQPTEPPREAEVSRARTLVSRLADILLGKVATLVLAALAFAVALATFIILARGSPLVPVPNLGVGLVLANLIAVLLLAVGAGRAVDPGLGRAAAWLRRLAPACAAGAAVRWRGGGARHRGRLLRGGVLPFRHPGLVQRSGAAGGDRIAAGVARLPGGASQQSSARSRWRWRTT